MSDEPDLVDDLRAAADELRAAAEWMRTVSNVVPALDPSSYKSALALSDRLLTHADREDEAPEKRLVAVRDIVAIAREDLERCDESLDLRELYYHARELVREAYTEWKHNNPPSEDWRAKAMVHK